MTAPTLRIVCCYCQPNHVMVEGDLDGPVSHGICPKALAKINAELDAKEKDVTDGQDAD